MTAAHPKMTLVLIDDEPPARDRARRLLAKADDVEIVGEADNGGDGLRLIERLQPDIALLDIQMPGVDGMRMLEALDDPPAVIFSTAYEQYALKAFELGAVDYLLKPYSAERLHRALDRVRRQFAQAPAPRGAAAPEEPRIAAEGGAGVEFFAPVLLAAARIEEDVVFLHLVDGRSMIYAKSLQALEEILPTGAFFRVSRQALIRLGAVEAYRPAEGGGASVRLAGGHEEAVSRRRARHLRALLPGGGD